MKVRGLECWGKSGQLVSLPSLSFSFSFSSISGYTTHKAFYCNIGNGPFITARGFFRRVRWCMNVDITDAVMFLER